MDSRVILLAIVCLMIGFYMQMQWLVMAMAIILVLGGIINASKPGTAPKPKSTADKVLYPVIYEDVGEPPLLYPERMEISYGTGGDMATGGWKRIPKVLGQLTGSMLARGGMYTEPEKDPKPEEKIGKAVGKEMKGIEKSLKEIEKNTKKDDKKK